MPPRAKKSREVAENKAEEIVPKEFAENSISQIIPPSRPVENLTEFDSFSLPVESLTRLTREFFDKPCVNLAKSLLGKILVRKFPENGGEILIGRIVETEAYLGKI